MTYDENSFMLGLSVGKTMKGASYLQGRDAANTGVVIVPELSVQYEACFIMPAPIICTVTEA